MIKPPRAILLFIINLLDKPSAIDALQEEFFIKTREMKQIVYDKSPIKQSYLCATRP